jgi:WD40 repeat protein
MRERKPAELAAFAFLALWLTLETTGAFAHPGSGIAVDADGRVFFTDTGRGIWRVDGDGGLTLISDSAMHWMAIDQEGKFANSPDEFGEWFGRLTPRGGKPTLISCSDFPCVVGKDGNLYFAKMHGLTIMRRTPHGHETILVSREDFGIAADRPVGISGMACGPDGTLYVVSLDSLNKHEGSGEHVLYAIGLDGAIRTVAKNFVRDLLPVSERHAEVRPQYCRGMDVDEQGNVFVAVTGNRGVMKLTSKGDASVILRATKPWTPTGVAVSQGNVYVLEYDDETPTEGRNWPPRVRKLSKDGKVVTIATVRGSGSARASEKTRTLVLQAPPAAAVNSVAVSPDGSLVATAAGEGGVRLYDAMSGQLLRVIGEAGDRGVSFSPDGRMLTAAGFHMDKLVGVFDVKTGRRMLSLAGHTEWEAYASALSPDGKLLASTGTDMQILVWEVTTGKLRHQLKDQPYKIAALAFSPDSRTLASGGGDRVVKLWDMTTGNVRRSLAGHGDWICAISFAPDGRTLASGSCDWGFHRAHDWPRPGGNEREVSEWRLWELDSGKPLRSETLQGRMLSVAFAPDGKLLACGIDKNLRLYDLSSEMKGKMVTTHDATITSIAFTPDGASVVTGSHDQTVKRTNLKTGQTEWQAAGYFEQVNSVALSENSALLVTGSGDHRFARGKIKSEAREIGPGALRVWDARTGRMLRRLGDTTTQTMAVAISAEGGRVVGGGGNYLGKGSVGVWDTTTGERLWFHDDLGAEVLCVALARDEKLVAAGTADGEVRLYEAETGKVMSTLTGHEGGVTSLVFSPNGKTLYCGQGHGGARVWDVQSGQPLKHCGAASSQAANFSIDRLMNSIGLTRDGGVLATCNSSVNNEFVELVRLWDARTGQLKREFASENIHGRPMALSSDGSIIATGGKAVQLWDARTGNKLRQLVGHLKRTQSIVFSADGRMVAAGGSYGTTNLWEVASGRHMATLFAFANPQASNDDWLAYTPDGYFECSPGREKYLGWRVGEEFRTFGSGMEEFRSAERVRSALQIE